MREPMLPRKLTRIRKRPRQPTIFMLLVLTMSMAVNHSGWSKVAHGLSKVYHYSEGQRWQCSTTVPTGWCSQQSILGVIHGCRKYYIRAMASRHEQPAISLTLFWGSPTTTDHGRPHAWARVSPCPLLELAKYICVLLVYLRRRRDGGRKTDLCPHLENILQASMQPLQYLVTAVSMTVLRDLGELSPMTDRCSIC